MPSVESLAALFSAVSACNDDLAWGLGKDAMSHYAAELATALGDVRPPEELRAAALNYHADHAQVAALRDALHPAHARAWEAWMHQVVGVLRRAGMAWSDDPAVEVEDLAQVARADLARALPSYRYESRFSSWAYRVVVQSATRQIRRARAEKRAVRPASLDQSEEAALVSDPAADPESAARARLLAERVATVLSAQPDQRLLVIFQQWSLEERGTAEIGALVRLHPSRVRALLARAREALRADPAIQAWHEGAEPRDEAA